MEKIILSLLISVLVPAAIYFAIAFGLTLFGKSKKPWPERGLDFQELAINSKSLPPLKTFTARDGKPLSYRHYPASSDKTVILLHGSGGHSRYFLPLADFISSEGLARVYTPDLRGHGYTPERRGDVDYIGQMEDDLTDFIALIRKDNPRGTLVIGGHSSGGGLAVRFAGSRQGHLGDAYLLLAPFLQYNAPTIRPNTGGWARPHIGRIIGLTMLNNVGIRLLNGLEVIEFNMPKEARSGTETLAYSHRLNTSYAPRDYKKDLGAMTQPLLLITGSQDEVFFPDQFEPVISQYTQGKVKMINGVTHLGVVVGPEVRPVIKEWLESLGKSGISRQNGKKRA